MTSAPATRPTTATSPTAPAPHPALIALTVGAIGVVFGDIGTSPLYAFREALNQTAGNGIDAGEILGVLSLAIWSLIFVVTFKYVLFLMRADNQGEGGVLALTALARRALGRRSLIALVLGAAGASLFYGDAIITPALSVLSAVEGLKTMPGIGGMFSEDAILGLTIVILIALFFIQSRGTASVSALFGPVCILWFLARSAGLGMWHIADEPSILRVVSPHYGVMLLASHGVTGLFVLGAVFLTVTGAEALTADMGHFGIKPIRLGWFFLVFPCLVLNYLGQGAFALNALEAATAAGTPFVNQDWFFLMAPDALAPLADRAGDAGDGDREPGGHHRGLLADAAGDPARAAATAARPPDLGDASRANLSADDQLAAAGRRAGAGDPVPHLDRDGRRLRHRGDRHDGGDDLPRLHRRAASLELGAPAGARR